MLAVSLFTSITVASAAGELIVNSWDFSEDWTNYEVADYTGSSGRVMKLNSASGGGEGDWAVHYEYPNHDIIQIVDGETWKHEGVSIAEGRGNVLYINNRISNGTYINIGYVGKDALGNSFYARNFTLEYDFCRLIPDSTNGWSGVISRWTGNGVPNAHYTNSINVITTVSITTGSGSDYITMSDGTTRPSTVTDYGWHVKSGTSSGSGSNYMTYESGIEKVSDRAYRVDGGGMRYTWFSARVEAKDSYYTVYLKEACHDDCEEDCKLHRWFDTGTRYYTDINNNIYSGTIGFDQCANEVLYDNIRFKSNDGNPVTATNLTKNSEGKEVGRAKLTSTTGAEGSVIELVSETESGYVFDKWYSDANCENPVTPVEFILQEHVLNTNFGLYDWQAVIGATDGITSWADLESKTVFVKDDKIVPEGTSGAEEMLWRDFYATSDDTKYRLITKVVTGSGGDGYDFYSTASLKKFNIKVYSNDETMGSVAIQGVDGNTGKFVLGQSGTFVATPQPGYVFAGWYKEVNGENPNDEGGIKKEIFTIKEGFNNTFDFTLEVASHYTYKAVFVPESALDSTLNIALQSLSPTATGPQCGSVLTVQGAYKEGEKVSLIAKENSGYAFVGWKNVAGDYISTDKYYDYVMVAGANDITAVFEIETYRIYVVDGIGSSEVERTAQANSRITLYPATAPTGYVFDGWLVTGIASTDWNQSEDGKLEINVTSRTIRVQARFVKVTRRVRVQINDSSFGSALGAGNKGVGDKVTITPSAKNGYTVSRYVVRGVDATINANGTLTFTMPDEDVIIRVEFTKIDKIDANAEIIMYAVFAVVGLAVVASVLFANNKDKRDKRS